MEPRGRDKIIVILGPTSSGKSDVAIKLAKRLNGEIISADSRQVYRNLDIGTGKTMPHEQGGIKHYLIDNVGPRANYSAARFKKDADKIIIDILERKKLPIICGGTGFWIKSVVDNVAYPEVKPNWELRNQLRNYSAEKLFKMLEKLDSDRAKNIDPKNKVRLIRAIEICKTLGKVPRPMRNYETKTNLRTNDSFVDSHNIRSFASVNVDSNRPYDFIQIGISLPKEKLHQNIKKRLEKRFEQGMIEEAEKLHKDLKLSWKKIESFGLGYFWIPKYLKGEIKTKEELFEKVYQAEKDYAKRQMTWFNKDKRIVWLENYKDIRKEVENFLKINSQ